jgi:1-phosphatidylinositol-3-phosphate 5-kinase
MPLLKAYFTTHSKTTKFKLGFEKITPFLNHFQENEQLEKTLSDVIKKCHPDVMLVEKAVSRNTNEYIQKQGVTVVSDMNIHRLERIARCTGSPIVLLQDVLTKPNLIEQCESIHFEKFIEEHDITGEDGRRTLKTYLFLEGFPKPLGCTVCFLFLLPFRC